MHSAILLLKSLDSRYSLRQKLVSKILMNVPDNGIVATKNVNLTAKTKTTWH